MACANTAVATDSTTANTTPVASTSVQNNNSSVVANTTPVASTSVQNNSAKTTVGQNDSTTVVSPSKQTVTVSQDGTKVAVKTSAAYSVLHATGILTSTLGLFLWLLF